MKPKLPEILSGRASKSRKSRKTKNQGADCLRFECDLFLDSEADTAPGSTQAQQIIATLNGRRSRTSGRMVRRLVALATEAIHELERLWREGNPHIREVASQRIDWPVLAGHHSAILKKNAEWIESIELAHHARNRLILAQLPARATHARAQTLQLLELVTHIQESAIWGESIHDDITQCDDSYLTLLRKSLRHSRPFLFRKVILTWPLVLKIKRLPLLGSEKDTIAQWQEITLELLSMNCNNNPAAIPELRVLGEHRRFHPYPASTDRAILEELVSPEKQSENISREIRDILRDEIRKICEHVRKLKNFAKAARTVTPSPQKPG